MSMGYKSRLNILTSKRNSEKSREIFGEPGTAGPTTSLLTRLSSRNNSCAITNGQLRTRSSFSPTLKPPSTRPCDVICKRIRCKRNFFDFPPRSGFRATYSQSVNYYLGTNSEQASLVSNDQYQECMVRRATAREKRGREDKSAQMYSAFSGDQLSWPG